VELYGGKQTQEDNSLYMWGVNGFYQIGDGTTTQRNAPKNVTGSVQWSKLGIGIQDFVIAVKTDGTLWGWGLNYQTASIGNGYSSSSVQKPSQLGSGSNWNDLSVGGSHTIISDKNGKLYSWGINGSGQLGVGDTTSRLIITPISNLSESIWNTFSAGNYHTLAIRNDRTLWGWGENNSAQ
jgi:hypothetical protein